MAKRNIDSDVNRLWLESDQFWLDQSGQNDADLADRHKS